MGFSWVPEALTQLNQYPSDRFWGMLVFSAFVIVVCVWLMVAGGKKIMLQNKEED